MAKIPTTHKLFSMQKAALLRMPPAASAVLGAIWEYTSIKRECAWPSVATLASVTEFGERTVQSALRRLESAGLVEVTIRGGNASNTYRAVPVPVSPFAARKRELSLEGVQNSAPVAPENLHRQNLPVQNGMDRKNRANAPENIGSSSPRPVQNLAGGVQNVAPGGAELCTRNHCIETTVYKPSAAAAHSDECANGSNENYQEKTTKSEESGYLSSSYKEETDSEEEDTYAREERRYLASNLRQVEELINTDRMTEDDEERCRQWLHGVLEVYPAHDGDPLGGWAYRLCQSF